MKNIILSLITFTLAVILDQITKRFGVDPTEVYYNQGIVFGLYAEVSTTLRVITLCSFGSFLLSIYLILLFFIPTKLIYLKMGISLLIGGVIGNVIDRMVSGTTIDFIPMPYFRVVFNLADVFQWIGAIAILINIWHHGATIWHPENQRTKYLILPKEQLRFCFKLVTIACLSSMIAGVFSFAYVRVILLENDVANATAILTNFFLAYSSITALFCVLAFIFGLYISHRSAGPVHAFSLFVDDLTQGNLRDFQLRDRDHFKQLEQIAIKLQKHFKP